MSRALPHLMARIVDASVPEDALSPVERAARDWRSGVITDLGGRDAITTARLALLDAATGSWIVLSSIDRYLFTLATNAGLVNRRSRRAFPILEQRMRIADSLARQLQALGLDRVAQRVPDLTTYVEQKYGTSPTPPATPSPRREPVPIERTAANRDGEHSARGEDQR